MKVNNINHGIQPLNKINKKTEIKNNFSLSFSGDEFKKSDKEKAKDIFKNNMGYPLSEYEARDMTEKYSKTKDGKINLSRAIMLASLFSETGSIFPDETDILFSLVYDKKHDEISYSKYICARYLILSMYDELERTLPDSALEKFASLYKGMAIKNAQTLIENNLIDEETDIFETRKAYKDWFCYSEKYKEKLNDSILLTITKTNSSDKYIDKISISDFKNIYPEISPLYDNNIYRMYCLLTQSEFKDYNKM